MSAVVTMSRITRKHGLQRFDGRSNSEARAHADARPDYPRAQAKKPAAAFTLVSALQPVDANPTSEMGARRKKRRKMPLILAIMIYEYSSARVV